MLNRETVVVTGATSFLGSSVVKTFCEKGYNVIAVVRKNSPNLFRLKNCNVKSVELDLENIQSIDDYIDKCDMFFHFSWDGSGSVGRNNSEIQYLNYLYSMNALKVSHKLGCRLFVFAGSQAEYGVQNKAVSENCECNPVSEYGKNKLRFGREGFKLAKFFGMKFLHLRVFSVFGLNDRPNTLIELCIDKFNNGGTAQLGACLQLWNYLYIKDFQSIFLSLIENSEKLLNKTEVDSVVNIGADISIPLKDYVSMIYDLSSKRGCYRLGNEIKNAEGSSSITPDITKLLSITNYQFQYSFKDGIKEIMNSKLHKCILCGNAVKSTSILEFENMPASAQNIPDYEALKNETGMSFNLIQCEKCGLVQLDCTPVDYYKDVIRSGGYSSTMKDLRTIQYKNLIKKYNLIGKKIIEIGCGQGEFLLPLKEFDVKPFGIENKKSLASIAKANGIKVFNGFINDDLEAIKNKGPFDAFLSFNFIEHQPDPNKMLSSIYEIMSDDGVGIITAPSFEYIIENGSYYEFIRDHIAYYTFDTLCFLANKNGFDVIEKEMINRDTLSVIVKKRQLFNCNRLKESQLILQNEFKNLIGKYKSRNMTVSVWGASHQGFTVLSTLKLGEKIEYVIDSAPFKQNKFAPSSHIPIVSPEYFGSNPTDAVIIIAPGYSDEIYKIIKSICNKKIDIYTLQTDHIKFLN